MKKFFLIVFLAIAIISCKKDAGVAGPNGPQIPPPPPPNSGNVAITSPGNTTGQKVEKTIGAAGGTITSADGKASLVIPAGALENNQTISIQPIENNAPLGKSGFAYRFLPHGLQFKKNANFVLNYTDEEMIGAAPELLKLATQSANGTWKNAGAVTLDKTNKKITAELAHFSDYSIYTSYSLNTNKTTSDTALIHVNTSQEISFFVVQTVELEDGLTIPIPAISEIIFWFVNGIENPPPSNNIGWIGATEGVPPHMCFRNYVAPFRAPASPRVTVSVRFNLGGMGQLFILRNVMIDDVNQFSLNGKTYDNAQPSGIIIDDLLSFGMLAKVGNKTAGVGLSIENLNSTPGTYQFTGSEDVLITAHDENGGHWASEKSMNAGIIYTGSIELTISGTGANRYITGKITGTLFGASGTEASAPINAVFGTRGF